MTRAKKRSTATGAIAALALALLASGCGSSRSADHPAGPSPQPVGSVRAGAGPAATATRHPTRTRTNSRPTTHAETPAKTGARRAPSSTGRTGAHPVTIPSPGPTPPRIPVRVPGHGDKSIQTFGTPAPSSQFPAIAAAVRSYALSVATDNAAAACRLLARGVIQQLVQGYGAAAHSSCPRLLAGLFDRYPTAYRRQLAHLRVTDARTQASRGYAFYTIPGAPPGFIPVSQEDAAWHLLAIAGSNLP